MDNIYIDTSIFEANNFLESKRINQLLTLGEEGTLQIILPAITYNEIKSRAIKNIKDAVVKHKKYRDETRVLRNISTLNQRFNSIDEEFCIKEFIEVLENRLKRAKCIHTDYPTVNIKEVFEKYFNDAFPFSKGEKKHEFPDAFALISIETWCKENRKKCYVFSNDKDLLNYKSDYLIIVHSLEKYLDEKLRQLEIDKKRQNRLELAQKNYEKKKHSLEQEIEEWLLEELDDFTVYFEHTDQEVHDVSIKNADVSLSDFQISSINEYQISMEARANIYYSVEIEIDDKDSSYYDSEEKDWVYLETTIERIEKHQIIPVQMKIDIPLAGDDYMDIEIDEINSGRELKI